MIRTRQLAYVLPLFFGLQSLTAQNLTDNGPYYLWFDKQVGIENTGLYEGILYKELYRTLNENTQFFLSPDFLPGSVVYDGQPYTDLLLKYNVYDDQVLLKVQDRLGGNTLQLLRDKVSRFRIDNRDFIHLTDMPAGSPLKGFYEISYQNTAVKLLTKHTKKLFERKDRSSLYYDFLDANKQHVVYYSHNYFPVNSKRDLTRIFPDLEEQIDDFYNRARVQRRTQPHAFMVALLTRIGSLLPLQNSDAF